MIVRIASGFLGDKVRDLGNEIYEFDHLYLQLVPHKIMFPVYCRTNMAGPIIRLDRDLFENLVYSQFEKMHSTLPEGKARDLNFNVMFKILMYLLLFPLDCLQCFKSSALNLPKKYMWMQGSNQ